MINELFFKLRVKKLDVFHIRQHLERQGFELVSIHSELGHELSDVLEIDFTGEKSLVYISDKMKYVFYDSTLCDDELEVVLLHECGHIHLNHKSKTIHNETEAWNFAYTVKNFHKKIANTFFLAISIVVLSFYGSSLFLTSIKGEAVNLSDNPKKVSESIQSQEKVYVTASGTKYHTKNCIYIQGKKTIPCDIYEAKELFLPCSSCIN
jgi:hypothetical protein